MNTEKTEIELKEFVEEYFDEGILKNIYSIKQGQEFTFWLNGLLKENDDEIIFISQKEKSVFKQQNEVAI